MNPKWWVFSKTQWVNILTAVAAILAALITFATSSPDLVPVWVASLALVVSNIINIVLRAIGGNQPLTLMPSESDKLGNQPPKY